MNLKICWFSSCVSYFEAWNGFFGKKLFDLFRNFQTDLNFDRQLNVLWQNRIFLELNWILTDKFELIWIFWANSNFFPLDSDFLEQTWIFLNIIDHSSLNSVKNFHAHTKSYTASKQRNFNLTKLIKQHPVKRRLISENFWAHI